jgi:antitoxin component YwqK of YwqJK toxin-antitoxin module
MKKLIICLFSIIMIQGCHIPFPQFKGKYVQFLDKDEKEVSSEYHTVLSKKPDGSFVFRQFFPETNQMTVKFSVSPDKKYKVGLYQEWWDDGTLMAEGQFENGKETGEWYKHTSGRGNYVNGKMEGEWKESNQKGQLTSVYNYKNGIRDGAFIKYDSLGRIYNEGIYRADTIFSQLKEKRELSESEIMPMLASCTSDDRKERQECSNLALLNYIYKNLKYPRMAREYGVQGSAIASFVIDKDGSIADIYIKRGLCQDIKNEIIRLLHNMPVWNPGIQRGKPVRVLFTLPIKFRLKG